MPNMKQFEDAESYFCALHHELFTRLAKVSPQPLREEAGESREEGYGFEELVAELGAAFLSATCGLDNSSRLDDASAYINGWFKALRDEKKLLLQAANAAQKAADFILGKAEEQTDETRVAGMRTNAKPCGLAQVVRRLRDFLLSLRRLPYPWFEPGSESL